MGASNAVAAYQLYAGKLPPTALNVLVYMAIVSLDREAEPRYWEGHGVLAARCFGAAEPVTEADLRAVRRAITPLFKAGAITVDRHSSGHGSKPVTVRYRLWLTGPAPAENRPVHKWSTQDGNRPTPTSGIGRKVVSHRTKSGQPPDGNRPPKEDEEDEERIKEQEEPGDRRTPRTGSALSRTAPWKIDFSGGEANRADPEAERRRQMDALMAFDRTTPGASP